MLCIRHLKTKVIDHYLEDIIDDINKNSGLTAA